MHPNITAASASEQAAANRGITIGADVTGLTHQGVAFAGRVTRIYTLASHGIAVAVVDVVTASGSTHCAALYEVTPTGNVEPPAAETQIPEPADGTVVVVQRDDEYVAIERDDARAGLRRRDGDQRWFPAPWHAEEGGDFGVPYTWTYWTGSATAVYALGPQLTA